jgi:opacity protein-like surface antigen
MKKTVVLLSVLGLVLAAVAEAAPKKRTRNANRVGPYGVGLAGYADYSSDTSEDEQVLIDSLEGQGVPFQNVTASSKTNDIGYQATFGYRFNRYMAAELGLVQIGDLSTKASGDLDFGDGFVPVDLSLKFSAGGPLFSFIGILPINDSFEAYGRVGYMFTSTEREIRSRVDGQSGGFGAAKGDSQDLVYGVGAAFHFNQVYSLRLEYQQYGEIGDDSSSGSEDVSVIGLGLVVRF